MKAFAFLTALGAVSLLLASCNSGSESGPSSFKNPKDAETDFEKVVAIAEEVFWRATDATMKANMGMKGQMTPWERFDAEHEAKSMGVSEKGAAYEGVVRIHNPSITTTYYELTFVEGGKGWDATDCKLMTDGHEMNYFEGKFLGQTSLKPFVDKAVAELLVP